MRFIIEITLAILTIWAAGTLVAWIDRKFLIRKWFTDDVDI